VTATASSRTSYFGAFGNNYVDDGFIKRIHDYYSLPGFRINEVSALNYVREMVEWNLPPYVFRIGGTPSFYLTWLRAIAVRHRSLADPGSDRHRAEYQNAGGQVDLSFTVLHATHDAVGRLCGGREPSAYGKRVDGFA